MEITTMPYIKQEDRTKFKDAAKQLGITADCAGDLNYIITEMVHAYIAKKGLRYSNVNEVVGMLDCCKMEFYRKVGVPYEDEKIKENGDVGLNENCLIESKQQCLELEYPEPVLTFKETAYHIIG